MIEFLKENGIAIFSLSVAIAALLLNRKISKFNSYSQRGNYIVFFQAQTRIRRWLFGPRFYVKIYNSTISKEIAFDYNLKIKPLVGGIYRTHIFDDIEKKEYIGITRTYPVIRTYKNGSKFPNKYAHQDVRIFSSSPLYSYFSVNGRFNKEEHYCENRLCRYHRYIEITDYCGNMEIWYVSFSLYLSNLEEDKDWKKCNEAIAFKYYKFGDLNIVSPRDVPSNLKAALQFNKDITTISGTKKDSVESGRFIELGYDKINSELQLYEMKKYILFLDSLQDYV